MTTRPFQTGDVVTLTCSYIRMTVRELSEPRLEEAYRQEVMCEWLNVDNALQTATFLPAQLQLITAAPTQA